MFYNPPSKFDLAPDGVALTGTSAYKRFIMARRPCLQAWVELMGEQPSRKLADAELTATSSAMNRIIQLGLPGVGTPAYERFVVARRMMLQAWVEWMAEQPSRQLVDEELRDTISAMRQIAQLYLPDGGTDA